MTWSGQRLQPTGIPELSSLPSHSTAVVGILKNSIVRFAPKPTTMCGPCAYVMPYQAPPSRLRAPVAGPSSLDEKLKAPVVEEVKAVKSINVLFDVFKIVS